MDFQIVEKGITIPVKDKAAQPLVNLYVGAAWAMAGAEAVDLDVVGACLVDGKITTSTRLVYFNDKTEPGVTLSEDNRDGAVDGDDENMLIDFSKIEPEVNGLAIGIVAYTKSDLASAKDFKFRGVKGTDANGEQVFEAKIENAKAGDTVLHAVTFKRGADGWTLENVSAFHACGNGSDAINGFAKLFS